MYNMFYKTDYLNTLENENTRSLCRTMFAKTEKLESQLDKDLFRFNMNEIDLLLFTLNAPHLNSLNTYINLLRKYTDYTIENGDRESNINLYKTISLSDLEKYVAKHKLKYVSFEEFKDVLKEVYNPIDYALYLALFEGIAGEKYSEISNLTIGDLREAKEVEGGYIITLTEETIDDEIQKREMKISNELYSALNKAYKQEEYIARNGEGATRIIVDGEFVFRNIVVNEDTKPKTDKQFIYRKLMILNKLTKSSVSNITTIINSGMIYYLSTLAVNDTVTTLDIKNTMEKYLLSINKNQPNASYNYFKKKHGDALKELYNVSFA